MAVRRGLNVFHVQQHHMEGKRFCCCNGCRSFTSSRFGPRDPLFLLPCLPADFFSLFLHVDFIFCRISLSFFIDSLCSYERTEGDTQGPGDPDSGGLLEWEGRPPGVSSPYNQGVFLLWLWFLTPLLTPSLQPLFCLSGSWRQ